MTDREAVSALAGPRPDEDGQAQASGAAPFWAHRRRREGRIGLLTTIPGVCAGCEPSGLGR
jgi:hypothetical protein